MYKKSHNTISDKAAFPQNKLNRNTKNFKILSHLASGLSLNKFQAERIGDHCLNTTISMLQKQYSIYFERELVIVPTRFNSDTRVMKYWLEDNHLERAIKLIKAA